MAIDLVLVKESDISVCVPRFFSQKYFCPLLVAKRLTFAKEEIFDSHGNSFTIKSDLMERRST